MARTLIRKALRRSQSQIRHVSPVPPGAAVGLVAAVYTQLERDFGMLAPPVSLHSPAPNVMAACWLMLRETLLAEGVVSRGVKEAVATAVSESNACPYCVEVHGATLAGLGQARPTGTIIEWVRRSEGFADARPESVPLPTAHVPEVVGVAVTFQYLNRMVNVFLGDSPLPPEVPAAARTQARWFLGRFMRPRGVLSPGDSLGLLPNAVLPADLWWTEGNPSIAGAFARASASIDLAADAVISRAVREVVLAALPLRDGRPLGLSRAWLEPLLAELPRHDRIAGRLALLTAMASYRVDKALIDEFRLAHGDQALIELTAWASWSAARLTGLPARAGR